MTISGAQAGLLTFPYGSFDTTQKEYVPDMVVGNAHLHARLGFDSDWIVKRTGILERRHAAPNQATSDLCVEAANDLATNRVQVYESAIAIAQPQLQAGNIKLLAVVNTARAPVYPDTPTVTEARAP